MGTGNDDSSKDDYAKSAAYGQLGGGAGEALGTAIARLLSAGKFAEAKRLLEESSAAYDGIQLPGAPERVTSAFGDAQGDAQAMGARREALARLAGISRGELSPVDQAQMALAKQEVGQGMAAQRGALMQQAQARGMGGSGMTLAAQLQGQDAGSRQLGAMGTRFADENRRRALEALMQYGQQAGSLDRDVYGRSADKAGHLDAIAQFNAENANRYGQNAFQDQMALAEAKAKGKRDLAGWDREDANADVGLGAGIGRGIGTLAGIIPFL
jgi:hypothetical protein